MTERTDGHHIIHNRAEWTLRPEAREIRETPELIPRIGRVAVHNEIHRVCPPLPLIGYHALVRTLSRFEVERGSTLETVDNLLMAMDYAAKSPKAHYIERAQITLAQWAIETQVPFLREAGIK